MGRGSPSWRPLRCPVHLTRFVTPQGELQRRRRAFEMSTLPWAPGGLFFFFTLFGPWRFLRSIETEVSRGNKKEYEKSEAWVYQIPESPFIPLFSFYYVSQGARSGVLLSLIENHDERRDQRPVAEAKTATGLPTERPFTSLPENSYFLNVAFGETRHIFLYLLQYHIPHGFLRESEVHQFSLTPIIIFRLNFGCGG